MNVSPLRATVVPRAIAPGDAQAIPVEDLILRYVDSGVKSIQVLGPGNTTALSHAAECLAEDGRVLFLNDATIGEIIRYGKTRNATLVFSQAGNFRADVSLRMADWTQDDVIEYLMYKSPDRCKSVMQRLKVAEDQWLANGSPALWSMVLDAMLDSDSVLGVEQAISSHWSGLELTPQDRSTIGNHCFAYLFDSEKCVQSFSEQMISVLRPATIRLLRNQTFRYVIGASHIRTQLLQQTIPILFHRRWPESFTRLVAHRITNDRAIAKTLDRIANERMSPYSSRAASLLVLLQHNWRPKRKRRLKLDQADLANVRWQKVSLSLSTLTEAVFSNADLREVNFSRSNLLSANFRGADLTTCLLVKTDAWRADFSNSTLAHANATKAKFRMTNFSGADLRGIKAREAVFKSCNLDDAIVSNADFSYANFLGATVRHVDFSDASLLYAILDGLDLRSAKLDSTCCHSASMMNCDLEGQTLAAADWRSASLENAILTATKFRKFQFRYCNFRNAKLADVVWEDCDLRGCNFTGTHFMMGSTRSGLVGSPYPSHGTRTGFYTDDYDDHYFKRPEEIRKAGLCGCDLRGAFVYSADFYLVDLRGAIYDSKQREHFLRCGAILED